MTCILVMKKNEDPNDWIVSARGDCDVLRNLRCYEDPPVADVPKATNPPSFVVSVSIPNCRGGAPEDGSIYCLENG